MKTANDAIEVAIGDALFLRLVCLKFCEMTDEQNFKQCVEELSNKLQRQLDAALKEES